MKLADGWEEPCSTRSTFEGRIEASTLEFLSVLLAAPARGVRRRQGFGPGMLMIPVQQFSLSHASPCTPLASPAAPRWPRSSLRMWGGAAFLQTGVRRLGAPFRRILYCLRSTTLDHLCIKITLNLSLTKRYCDVHAWIFGCPIRRACALLGMSTW